MLQLTETELMLGSIYAVKRNGLVASAHDDGE